MNIDQYRAMKADMEKEQATPPETGEQTNVQTPPTDVTPEAQVQTQTTQVPSATPEPTPTETNPPEPEVPNKITLDGKEVSLDEIKQWQQGHLRQDDYTRKTQELAKQRRELEPAVQLFEAVQQNPELLEQLSPHVPLLNPEQRRLQELENTNADLLLERELNTLQTKYTDFDTDKVLQTAYAKQMTNLEDAYLLVKASESMSPQAPAPQETTAVDIDSLKESLRQELLAELKGVIPVDTSTIISTNSGQAPIPDATPNLTPAQQKVARHMRMTDEDYAKWYTKR